MGNVTAVSTTGGTGTCSETKRWVKDFRGESENFTELYTEYGAYSLMAKPASGWIFLRWEMRTRHVRDYYYPGTSDTEAYGPVHEDSWSVWYPFSTYKEATLNSLTLHYERQLSSGEYDIEDYCYECRAVFGQGGTDCTVTVNANPANGGTVTGGGRYAVGETCTISATPATGYTFLRWKLSDGGPSKNVSHSFTVVGDTTATAYFKQSNGQLLHGAGGTLLFCSSGVLLFDG